MRPLRQRLQRIAVNLMQAGVACDIHQDVEVRQEGLHLVSDALLATDRERVHPQAPDEDEFGAERERLEDVGSAADARVEHNL